MVVGVQVDRRLASRGRPNLTVVVYVAHTERWSTEMAENSGPSGKSSIWPFHPTSSVEEILA